MGGVETGEKCLRNSNTVASSCGQWSQIGPLQGAKTEISKHSIERRQGNLIRRYYLNPNRFSIASKINHKSRLHSLGSIALVFGTARQIVVRSQWPAMSKRYFQI